MDRHDHVYDQDPNKRASAREVETYLKERLEEIDPGRLDHWMKALEKAKQ